MTISSSSMKWDNRLYSGTVWSSASVQYYIADRQLFVNTRILRMQWFACLHMVTKQKINPKTYILLSPSKIKTVSMIDVVKFLTPHATWKAYFFRYFSLKTVSRIAKSVELDQTAPLQPVWHRSRLSAQNY